MTVYGQENCFGKDMWGYDVNPGCSAPYNFSNPSSYSSFSNTSSNDYYTYPSSNDYYTYPSSNDYYTYSSDNSDSGGGSYSSDSRGVGITGIALIGLCFSALFLPKINSLIGLQNSAPATFDFKQSDISQRTQPDSKYHSAVPQNTISKVETLPVQPEFSSAHSQSTPIISNSTISESSPVEPPVNAPNPEATAIGANSTESEFHSTAPQNLSPILESGSETTDSSVSESSPVEPPVNAPNPEATAIGANPTESEFHSTAPQNPSLISVSSPVEPPVDTPTSEATFVNNSVI